MIKSNYSRKNFIAFVLSFSFMLSFAYSTALQVRADSEIIKLVINGGEKEIRPKILYMDEVIYIPIAGITKFLFGSFADYDYAAKKIIAVNKNASVFTNQINTNIISVNGGKIEITDCSFKKSGDYYVTGEFLKTVFGISCKFDENNNTVIISQTAETDVKKLPQEIQELDKAMLLSHYQPKYLERYIKYRKKHPELTYFDVVTYVNIGLDFPFYSGMIINQIKNPAGRFVLCNKYNYLPEDYIPEGYKKTDGRVLFLTEEAQEQFDKMRADAAKAGISIYIVSGYRSYAIQKQIYNNYKRQDPNGADTYSARPGHSEHQTGLAADLNTAWAASRFENTKEYAWLVENAHKYGFILRYPKGKEWITGYIYEPWHWRYVGVKTAEKIKDLDITYDEYYAIYRVPQNFKYY